MTTFDNIRNNRRLVKSGIWTTAGLAILVFALRVLNTEFVDVHEVAGSIALAVALGIPAAIAWISLDRRPTVLPAAIWGSIVAGLFTVSLLPLYLIPAYLWWKAWRMRPAPVHSPGWAPYARIGLAALVFVSAATLFAYENPRCLDTLADGTTLEVDASSRGFESGWTLGLSGSSSSTGSADSSGVSSQCESDRIVLAEALASLLVSASAVLLAVRWPQGTLSDRDDAGPGPRRRVG